MNFNIWKTRVTVVHRHVSRRIGWVSLRRQSGRPFRLERCRESKNAISSPVLLVWKCPWRVALDTPKSSNFFTSWQKMNAQQKWKLQSSKHSILLPVRMEFYEKSKTYDEESWKFSRNQSSILAATMSFSIAIIAFCCSSREIEKNRLKLWRFNQLIH